MEDIAPTLLDEIEKTFKKKVENDTYIKAYLKKLQNGAVDFTDTQLYSKQLGVLLGNTFKEVLKEDVLPDGRLYWNIAERVMTPMLKNNHELVNTASIATQKILDLKDGIGLKPLKPKLRNDRIKSILDNVTVEGLAFEEVQKRMTIPIINLTESFFDDFILLNADFRYKAGLKPQIIRTLKGKACDWCKSLAGVYDYGEIGINSDVFKRHQNCHCQVIYKTIKYKQDVWSKKITTLEKSSKESTMELDIQFFAEKDIKNQDSNSLKRAIRKYNKRMQEHEEKILNPKQFYPNWDSFDERYKNGLIKHWKKEINTFKTNVSDRINLLKERGEYDE